MWYRFAEILRCPGCRSRLEVDVFAERDVEIDPRTATDDPEIGVAGKCRYIDEGVLECAACRASYPIVSGVPVMLTYSTPLHRQFAGRWADRMRTHAAFPSGDTPPGEDDVRASFSTEWTEYDYDGVIWELDYAAHEQRFRKEVGSAIDESAWYLEVGCGLGLATATAQQLSRGDAVGLDLSAAAFRAARQFERNPRMHFVQASAFKPPFADGQFDVLYSRGVLHHTYTTKGAFESVARLCRRGGTCFVWLYGPGSIEETLLRRLLYATESIFRPVLSRSPDGVAAKAFLGVAALGYMLFNRLRRIREPAIQPLTFRRAVHAARDRFTPRFAHRHSAKEISSWFGASGFGSIAVLDWREMPPADQDDFRRNVGVRGCKPA